MAEQDFNPYQVQEAVCARSFKLVDNDGRIRADLGLSSDDGSPGFTMYNKGGKAIVKLVTSSDGNPAFVLFDDYGKPRIGLHIVDGRPRLDFADEKGDLRVSLFTSEEQELQLSFYDSDEKARVSLLLKLDGESGIFLADKDGIHRCTLAISPDGKPALKMTDEYTYSRAELDLSEMGNPELRFNNESGNEFFSIP